MNSFYLCSIALTFIFGGALVGMYLNTRLPEHHLLSDSKDTVKVGAGIVSTLAALVLGLLVSSAKDSFDTMSAEITQSSSRIVLLDRLLANYGPETKATRVRLRESIGIVVKKVWPEDGSKVDSSALEKVGFIEPIQMELLTYSPSSEAQRVLMSQAQQLAFELRQTRWLLVEQSRKALPTVFLIVLIFWLAMMHLSFGLFAPRNLTVMSVLFISALSISCAIFLIIELSHPLYGLIKVSGAPMHNALDHLGQP